MKIRIPHHPLPLAALALGLILALPAQAALHDRGGGLLYDDVLNLTWLQDANYAKTSGYDADGKMTWSEAKTWAESLTYGGYDDWRLAANTPINGSTWLGTYSAAGTTDNGYNITSPNSELSYMYYVNLGLKGQRDTFNNIQSGWGVFGNGTTNGTDDRYPPGQNDVGLVKNLQAEGYFSGTDFPGIPVGLYAYGFNPGYGIQGGYGKAGSYYAWAVRAGDVAPVPEPESYALLLAGLGLLGVISRRRKQKEAAV